MDRPVVGQENAEILSTERPWAPKNGLKTQPCFKHMTSGKCNFNPCKFAHSLEEIHPSFLRDEQNLSRLFRGRRPREEQEARDTEAINVATSSSVPNPSSPNAHGSARTAGKRLRVCYQWEATGTCTFGIRCRYPHEKPPEESLSESNPQVARKQELEDVEEKIVVQPAITISNSTAVPLETSTAEGSRRVSSSSSAREKTISPASRWKWPAKISRIYGDWIDE